MASSMNQVELYNDPALDHILDQTKSRSRSNGTNRRSSVGQETRSFSESLSSSVQNPPAAPEVPRGPPISYRALGQGEGNIHRSFSQRAKGRPFHREAFADMDDEFLEENVRPQARITSDPVRRDVPAAISRKPAPTDGLTLNTTAINGPAATGAPRRDIPSAREMSSDPNKFTQKPRRISDTPRRTEEPMSAVSRSSAFREEAQRRDWAPDRSPLQKLEVTLSDISKEEKRARVQEAEMLLRERGAKAAHEAVESSRETNPLPKASFSTRRSTSRRDRVPEPETPTLEDAGLVRNLSNTQRQRLQHSTTVDNHRPDVRSLSGEGHPGFDYSASSPMHPDSASQSRQSSGKYRKEEIPRQDRAPGALSRKQRDTTPTSAEGRPADGPPNQVSSRAPRTQAAHGPVRGDISERQRNASHKAALEKLTGVDGPASVTRSGSRKLQKAPPVTAERRTALTGKTPSRIPVPSTVTTAATTRPETYDRGLHDPNVDISRSQQRPHTPPIGLGLQSSPHPSSPRSPAEKVADVTRQRQRKSSVSFKEPINRRPVDEWKEAGIAKLTAADLSTETATPVDRNKAWWEQAPSSSGRRRSRSTRMSDQAAFDGPIDDKTAEFKPKLYLRCGPLLQYTGMKREKTEKGDEREFWRGSVLIVTQDSHSSYDSAPTLRLFSQPQKLLPPPPHQVTGDELNPEYVDPIAGLIKLSRTGRALYVRPVDHLEEGKDLSQMENDDGLFESTPSPLDFKDPHTTPNKRTLDMDGERLGRYQEVTGARLYADPDRDVTFWRFNLEIELGHEQQHIGYRINRGPAVGFWVQARGQSMNIMFHTCNGFSLSVNPDHFSGPDPMWRDVLNTHQTRPFHVMIGGGDQIYNDRVVLETQHFGEWTKMRNPARKHHAPFSNEMKEELETFYLNRYALWFSQGLFAMAASQIPMVNIWDDHDIIDGFGSYPHHFMETPVFTGLGNVAFKYYMLFQHQSVAEETTAHEPSWLLGREPGPYIKQLSRSVFMHMGKHVAFLGLDCRTERMRGEVLSVDTLDIVLERCRKELIEGETKHLIVLLGVPVAYPRLVWLENVLTNRLMDPVKALGKAGILKKGFLNKFDGGVEILDDLDDHWTATSHKQERNEFIKDLQDLAAEKSCRITILSGDVHLAAVGQFYSNPKLKIPKDRDHRYMPNVISSAIVNAPPSDMLADILNKRNKTHHLDEYTDENMIPMFTHDVDNRNRNNKHLLPRRNWCSIREYMPGLTPPPSPPAESDIGEEDDIPETRPRRFSFSKENFHPRTLVRRLSSRNAPPTSYRDMMYDQGRSASHDGAIQPNGATLSQDRNASGSRPSSTDFQAPLHRRAASLDYNSSGTPIRPGLFQRRPTNWSEKAAKKGNILAIDADGNEFDVNDDVNLEGGLDVVVNVEVNPKDPSGITMPYRLLIPALWYDGSSDREKLDEATGAQRKPTLLNRIGLGGKRIQKTGGQQGDTWNAAPSDEESYSEGDDIPKAPPPRRRFSLFGSRKQKKEEYFSDSEEDHDVQPNTGAPASQPQRWQQPGSAVRSSSAVQPKQAEYQMSHNMTSPPNHDMLYDTEHPPPPSHSLEPAPHPSVRRSLTISSSDGPSARMNRGASTARNISGSYTTDSRDSTNVNASGQDYDNTIPSSTAATSSIPSRRLSKQERFFGVRPYDDSAQPSPQLRGNGITGNNFTSDDGVQHYGSAPARGYSGIEAYKEPRTRRTFSLRRGLDWLDGRNRDDEQN
ncbi:uncharacterized protein Z518_09403 [Rhinocladiella mackenziei CBS 650.93]|uniref:PhoD-like phosphatase domain-containing protein n=1 Tax=Rhinocladiella mackenziei CBS 650.93 TaxID=1442369 RepID=A0A0D2FI41_9EURO|nr:uncharacterized protein Z518_09403 [Rhinocladiella mackenziei CBS 650.93]KIX01677.1 hypothetical protein Z518_09403 [Rhinocladiella mackenziei CBS 650.93]